MSVSSNRTRRTSASSRLTAPPRSTTEPSWTPCDHEMRPASARIVHCPATPTRDRWRIEPQCGRPAAELARRCDRPRSRPARAIRRYRRRPARALASSRARAPAPRRRGAPSPHAVGAAPTSKRGAGPGKSTPGFPPDVFDRVDQPLRPAVQPVDRLVGVGRRLAILDRARVEVTVDAVGDDLRGPAITAADVPQQVGKAPTGTRRYRVDGSPLRITSPKARFCSRSSTA